MLKSLKNLISCILFPNNKPTINTALWPTAVKNHGDIGQTYLWQANSCAKTLK